MDAGDGAGFEDGGGVGLLDDGGSGEFGAGVSRSLVSPVAAVGDLIVDRAPGSVIRTSIRLLGTAGFQPRRRPGHDLAYPRCSSSCLGATIAQSLPSSRDSSDTRPRSAKYTLRMPLWAT